MKRSTVLYILFTLILVVMVTLSIWASLEESVVEGGYHLTQYRWGWATLADTYFGFLTFFVWVYLRERTTVSRIIWFVLIMSLGNMAMATYALLQLRAMSKEDRLRILGES